MPLTVHGDRDASLFGGYTCPKGRLARDPLEPGAPAPQPEEATGGSHEQIASEQLVVEVAERLWRSSSHSQSSVAMYTGT